MTQSGWFQVVKQCLLAAVIFLLQLCFADRLRIFGVAPNFVLAFVLALSFLKAPRYSFCCALILGFCLDSVSGRFFGTYTALFTLVAFGIREFYHSAFSENFVMEAFYGLITCGLYSLCYAFFTSIFEGNFWMLLYRTAFIEFIYNFVIFLLMLLIQKRNLKKNRSVFHL